MSAQCPKGFAAVSERKFTTKIHTKSSSVPTQKRKNRTNSADDLARERVLTIFVTMDLSSSVKELEIFVSNPKGECQEEIQEYSNVTPSGSSSSLYLVSTHSLCSVEK